MKRLRKILLLFIMLFASTCLIEAQSTGALPSNLNNIHVDQLSDDQIQQIVLKMNESGYTLDQLGTMALAQGMSVSEINKLKARINSAINKSGTTNSKMSDSRLRSAQTGAGKGDVSTLLYQFTDSMHLQNKLADRLFGYSLFNNKNLTFQPSLNIPTPKDYQLGSGDEVIIDVWGASQQNYRLTIAPDGFILIDNVGPINIAGLTVDDASKKVVARLSSIYAGLKGSNPSTWAQLTLGNIRSIQINVIGEVNNPGTYTLSSLSTVFNALFLSGGPNKNGTLRNIEVIRNNKVIDHLDVYDFLLKGDQSNNIRLEDQDIVRVPPYVCRMEFTGEVKSPFIYEVKDTAHERLSTLISFTGGFTDKAYSDLVKVYRKNKKEWMILDVPAVEFSQFILHDGDSIPVEHILNRFSNRITVQGAVFRPGDYALTDSMRISQLIAKAEGLKEDAYVNRALLFRTKSDNSIEVIPLNLKTIFENPSEDLFLKREDLLKVSSIFDLREDYKISVKGQVKNPGEYPYVENSSVRDYIVMAGGLLESASASQIEVARRMIDSIQDLKKTAEIYHLSIDKSLSVKDSSNRFILKPFDQVYVRQSPGYEVQQTVTITGEIKYPDDYVLARRDERISDLVSRSGGLTPEAYVYGARLTRKLPTDEIERQKALIALMKESRDSINMDITTQTEQAIGIDLKQILLKPHSDYDLILQPGDILYVPKLLQTVRLSGSVLYPVSVRYNKNFSFKRYISQAGGYTEQALPSKSYVLYANGSVDRTRNFLFMSVHPKIEPGAEIIVPKKIERRRMSATEVLGLSSAMASLTLVIVSILNNIKL